ncbi:MAG: orotidine-5'-phosphate decarboxylase [Candidatus Omnitrophica bacterium]|nr:orotidine-5'-phosphate decarboxylase [Candidatus Omnitrophota bacterium]MCM8793777.1 orotidine-5'-phosphate decarboxylase [Candidatus Omnitrophota bacterium]
MKRITERLIIALDVENLVEAERAVESLIPAVKIFKVGAQLFTACGPEVIQCIKKQGGKVFLDLKYHDIPHTVAKAVEIATLKGVFMLTLHIQGGFLMLKRALDVAKAVAKKEGLTRPLLLGVTVLTSLEHDDLLQLGIGRSVDMQVLHLTRLALKAGLDGVVSSSEETRLIRQNFGEKPLVVTPGIRLKKISADDQKRIATPEEALRAGADYIVIGRPVLKANNPLKEAEKIKAIIKEQEEIWEEEGGQK